MAGRSHPGLEARGGARGEGWQLGGATRGAVAARASEGLEEPSHVEGQEGRGKAIPLVQGNEQQLRFAGAAVKRYPTPKVGETHVRW